MKKVGICYDYDQALHRCYGKHVENPSRVLDLVEGVIESGLIDRLQYVPIWMPEKKDLLRVHSEEMIELVNSFEQISEMENKFHFTGENEEGYPTF